MWTILTSWINDLSRVSHPNPCIVCRLSSVHDRRRRKNTQTKSMKCRTHSLAIALHMQSVAAETEEDNRIMYSFRVKVMALGWQSVCVSLRMENWKVNLPFFRLLPLSSIWAVNTFATAINCKTACIIASPYTWRCECTAFAFYLSSMSSVVCMFFSRKFDLFAALVHKTKYVNLANLRFEKILFSGDAFWSGLCVCVCGREKEGTKQFTANKWTLMYPCDTCIYVLSIRTRNSCRRCRVTTGIAIVYYMLCSAVTPFESFY